PLLEVALIALDLAAHARQLALDAEDLLEVAFARRRELEQPRLELPIAREPRLDIDELVGDVLRLRGLAGDLAEPAELRQDAVERAGRNTHDDRRVADEVAVALDLRRIDVTPRRGDERVDLRARRIPGRRVVRVARRLVDQLDAAGADHLAVVGGAVRLERGAVVRGLGRGAGARAGRGTRRSGRVPLGHLGRGGGSVETA